MLCFGIIMTRDGMQEMSRYALVFAVLCSLNFFFDLLPLLTELGGRVQSKTVPVSSGGEGRLRQTVYTVTVKTSRFFDVQEGFTYNVQSLGMLLSPLCMALGTYLSLSAYNEFQRGMPAFLDEDYEATEALTGRAPDAEEGNAPRQTAPQGNSRSSVHHFQGRSYKLA